ncbi:hypothetical protein OIO90_005097 [Microbotryomycetes sp. JL221]|nr:hypothetical protein OIO90_005097 [Microbotryomycetes sp. JL221]
MAPEINEHDIFSPEQPSRVLRTNPLAPFSLHSHQTLERPERGGLQQVATDDEGHGERRPLLPRTSQSFNDVHGGPSSLASRFSPAAIKRRSARVSDLLSGNNHSALPAGGSQDPEDGDNADRSSIRSRNVGYDGDFRSELEGEGGSGVRQWYDNFHTIDWIHDSVKDSFRRRRLRQRRRDGGVRGLLVNLWDGSQGWILVTLIGFFTACVAFCIISSEMVLFDFKDGYCGTNLYAAKRFCCPLVTVPAPDPALAFGLVDRVRARLDPAAASHQAHCSDWRTWKSVWEDSLNGQSALTNTLAFATYLVVALAFATLASTMTIYLTASTSVFSSKDSPSVPYPGFSPDFPAIPTRINSMYGSFDVANNAASSGDTQAKQLADSEIKQSLARPRKTLYFAAGSGIPEIKTILSGFVIRGYLGVYTLVTKAVGLTLSVASGLSLGKEGPFVHIASAVSNILSRFFPKYDRNEAKRREIISAGCAAGVAVSFGAPVGGTLFSLEEVSYYFPPRTMIRSFCGALIAAMSLKLLDPFKSGKIVLFEVTYDRDWHTFELLGFLLLGIFGGLYGAVFCKCNVWWTRRVRNGTLLKAHPIFEVFLVTLITASVSYWSPWLRKGGTELVSELFSECHRDSKLGGLCVDLPEQVPRLVAGMGVALLVKSTLAVGAFAGRIAGLVVEVMHARNPELALFESCRKASEQGPLPFGQSCVLPGVWAMIGAAATLAGVTRTTVSLAVIMFELTGSLTYSVPVMLGVLTAKTVADAVEPRSIYDLVLEVAELPYLDSKIEYTHQSTVAEVMDSKAPFISLDDDNTFESIRAKVAALYAEGTGSGFPIVAIEREHGNGTAGLRCYGYIACKELEHGLIAMSRFAHPSTPCTFRTALAARNGISLATSRAQTPAGHDLGWLIDPAPIAVSVRSPMELLHELFIKLGVRYLLVHDERGLHVGVIEKVRAEVAMSVSLDDPDLRAAYHAILGGSEYDWLLFGYKGTRDRMFLYDQGTSGLQEMRSRMLPDEIMFGLLRSIGSKLVLVNYMPEDSISGVQRARALVHARAVASAFRHDASLNVAAPAALTSSTVEGLLCSINSGSPSRQPGSSPNAQQSTLIFSSPSQYRGPYNPNSATGSPEPPAVPDKISPYSYSPLTNGVANLSVRDAPPSPTPSGLRPQDQPTSRSVTPSGRQSPAEAMIGTPGQHKIPSRTSSRAASPLPLSLTGFAGQNNAPTSTVARMTSPSLSLSPQAGTFAAAMLIPSEDDEGEEGEDEDAYGGTDQTASASQARTSEEQPSIQDWEIVDVERDQRDAGVHRIAQETQRRLQEDQETAARLQRERGEREAAERAREAAEKSVQAQREFDRRERQKLEHETMLRRAQEEREERETQDKLSREEQRRADEAECLEQERRRKEEEERSRLAKLEIEKLVAQQRREVEQRAMEEAKRKREEQERARREMREGLLVAKNEGRPMLEGHVSAQTGNSIELDLALTTVATGSMSSVERDPEESAVPNSLKVIMKDGDEFMLYTDSPLEREWLVAALQLSA